MKKSILLLAVLPRFVLAQSTLMGTIIDEKRNPIPFANIFLQPETNTSIVGYGQSDEKGVYQLKTYRTGKLWLNFSAMSYRKARIPVELVDSQKVVVNNAVMIYEPIPINEVIVSADKSMVIKKDTIIFNAKAFAKGNERVVEDLLKNIPGLEISEEGVISIGNREIEKVMVDGDDFFEKGYQILTKNMPAYPIEKVEVYQNYSNNRLLKGIEKSEKVALNLKLSEDAKNQWFGNMSLGYGPLGGNRYDAFGNLMNFGKKNKFYGISSLNNVGQNAVMNIDYLIRPKEDSETGNFGENQHARTLVGISPYYPNLKQNRIRFNQSAVYSLNGIFAPSAKVKVKVLAFINKDQNSFFKNSFESTSIGDTRFINTEDHQLKTKQLTGFGKLDITNNISKDQTLVFTGKFNRSNENSHNSLTFNDSVTNELLENNNTLSDQKLIYTHRLNPQKAFLFSGRYIYEQSPQHYSIDRFFYQDLFPTASQADFAGQFSENRMHFGGFEANLMDKKKNGNLFAVKFGNQYRRDQINSDFQLQAENIVLEELSGYNNRFVYAVNDLYLGTSYTLQLKNLKLNQLMDLHQLFNQMEKAGKSSNQHPFYINPRFGITWTINEKNRINTMYSYNHTNAAAPEVLDQYIQTGFRAFSKGTGNFNQLNSSSFTFIYTLGNWGEKFFANAFLIYNRNHDYFSNNTLLSKNYSRSQKMLIKNKEDLNFSSNIDRYFKFMATNIKIVFGLYASEYQNMVNSALFRKVKMKNYNLGAELRSGFSGLFNYHLGSKWLFNEIITLSRSHFTDNFSFMDLNFVFNSKFDVKVQTERYFFGGLDKANNCYYFVDFTARYTPKQNKFNLTLSGYNLLNTKTFRNYSIDDISISKTEYRLLPRHMLLSLEFRF